MILWYLNNSDEPEKDVCKVPAVITLAESDAGRLELTKRILKEGVWTKNRHGETIWIPPHRILRVVL